MARPEKIAAVTEMKERLESNQIAIATQYVGINVEKVTELRRQLRAAGVEFKVYKNTLARRALNELNIEGAAEYMSGPTAWAFSNDPVAPAKILKDFARKSPKVVMVGGVLNGKPVSGEQLKALASLPSRDQLLAQVVGTIAAPLRNFVGVLNAVPRNLVGVLDAIEKKKAAESAA